VHINVSPPSTVQVEAWEDAMTSSRPLAAPAAIMLALAGRASVDVHMVASPDANLGALHTFNVMPNPQRRAPGAPSTDDPMPVSSISSRALRADLVKGFDHFPRAQQG